jgi:hypothetical protein
MSELGYFILGAGAFYVLTRKGILNVNASVGISADPVTKLPDVQGGGAPGDDTARAAAAASNPVVSGPESNSGIMGPNMDPIFISKPDVLGSYRRTYGTGYGNNVSDARYTPVSVSKYTSLSDDVYNSSTDSNGGMVIGSGYR